jgi:hypothetical protein
MNILIPIIIVILISVILWGWSTVLRRIPLNDYGLENVERVLKLESDEYRAQVLQRGWMTHKEWNKLQKKHEAALNQKAN